MVAVDAGTTGENSYKPMGEADTAIGFFDIVKQADPEFFAVDHIMLELWDYGGTWMGAQSDDYTGGLMNLAGIKKKTDKAAVLHGDKIDIIGFDDCLMSCFEDA